MSRPHGDILRYSDYSGTVDSSFRLLKAEPRSNLEHTPGKARGLFGLSRFRFPISLPEVSAHNNFFSQTGQKMNPRVTRTDSPLHVGRRPLEGEADHAQASVR